MREDAEPRVFHVAYVWVFVITGAVALISALVVLPLRVLQQDPLGAVFASFMIGVGAMFLTTVSRRVEVYDDRLHLRDYLKSQTIMWSDVEAANEVDGLAGDWWSLRPSPGWRTSWLTVPYGKGVHFHLRKRGILNWHTRKFVNARPHNEFVAALEAAGLPVRRLDAGVK